MVYLVISIRNVGTGLAVMHGWHVEVTGQPQQTHPPLEDFTTQTRDIYVASGDIGFWQGALRNPATARFKAVAAAVETGDPMMLNILGRRPRRWPVNEPGSLTQAERSSPGTPQPFPIVGCQCRAAGCCTWRF